MDTQLKAEILPDSPEQKALVKEMKRVELQLQNLDRKTLKNENENVVQHQPASPRWIRITPTFKCFTQPWVSAKRRGAVVTACRGSIHDPIRAISRRAFRTPLFFILDHLFFIPKYVSQPFSGSLRPSATYSFCMSTFSASPLTIAVTEKQKKALVKEMKRVELQLQNLGRKTLKNENVAQHQPASPRWSRITPTVTTSLTLGSPPSAAALS
ncbi:uncharacterized protein [Drosophila pseudoobscura]|uniref:Uncharacterized protein isoform X2 n=1 Tax=Drosophila pseudoobscura pseudoobscura TaxID=46245 RepID=A0A6I8VZT8_DROPS|nr:uncharacterized protein LOC6902492 isoform X2 [Drosophila pseudoobscura]